MSSAKVERPMILFLTTADTEVLAAAEAGERLPAGFPHVRPVNPVDAPDDSGELSRWLDEVLKGVVVVLVRLLGGRRAWPAGFDLVRELCQARNLPLLAFGGEDVVDAELTAASTVPSGVIRHGFEYLRHGGVENTVELLRFVADTVLFGGFGFGPPTEIPRCGWYRPELKDRLDREKPTIGVIFYRAHFVAGNMGFIDALLEAIEASGANPLAVYAYSLRPEADGRVPALELLADGWEGGRKTADGTFQVDALVLTVLAMGGSNAADAESWEVPALQALDVPVVQALCATSSRERWAASDAGLSPLDVAMQVAMPEFDGRIVTVPCSFKEEVTTAHTSVYRYVPDPERAARVAGTVVRHALLRRTANADKKVAILLSNYPTRHSRVGNAVGLDTPASAIVLLESLREAGFRVEGVPPDGDSLVHALIASGGHDQEFLTEAQLAGASGRLEAERYAAWFQRLPVSLREAVERHWGPPPGELYLSPDRRAFVVSGLVFGHVFVGIQPPRGFGENPIAIYHDPHLPPTHHYLAAYCWLREEFGAHAVVHLGKHGTLEWLPGKGLGLSAGCAPDAALGDLPLFYPFVVNDPGEGTQAKRRAHATIVDHLVAPMMRAETYDDLARLEQLLDEHAQVESLDPSKLPAIRAQIWEVLTRAELHRDLSLSEPPEDFGELVLQVDGYLCEIKDLQVRDGLHVLGVPPEGEQLRGLAKAILRLPQRAGLPGLRSAVGQVFGLDERWLLEEPGQPSAAPPALLAIAPGAARTRADLLDRLEELVDRLLEALDAKGWDASAAEAVVQDVLLDPPRPAPAEHGPGGGRSSPVIEVLRLACAEVVPRLRASSREVEALLAGLDGRFVPPGPSGSPTRGRLDVLPTGKNFYSVDPKGLPSRLAWEVGQRMACDLLARYQRDEGALPESIGIVVWGTANMRTNGDDIAEVLALLGVRPLWSDESRRVIGLEVTPLEELGRPRVDVTVRISGFFRDAFPHLVELVDRAVEMVASLDEPDEWNFVAKHARTDQARHRSSGVAEDIAWRRATTRIFGSKPGAYGAGLLPLLDARNWRSDDDLAEVYAVWGGYAYGRDLDGVQAREEMETNFRRMAVAVKNQDTREHDLFDSDDYFQYHGGMVAAVRALTGANPKAYVGDSADPSRLHTRSLQEETHRVFRARVVNPRWIASMRRHGYKGAFELSATVDYLFGYDATAGVVDDWMYEALASRYVFDPETRAFLERSNPWALKAMVERLLEAAERGLWAEPGDGTLDALRAAYLDVDGELEGRT
ncbi:MAG: cobaltochelatase subunit CobN [Nitriliruptorales bacterium]